MISKFSLALLVAGAAFGLGSQAAANSLDKPGSLLLFPVFDNSRLSAYAITVTNTNSDTNQQGNLLAGTVDVEFVYIEQEDCLEFNRTRRLTPNDTLTVLTRLDNPNASRGYVYVFAKSPTTGQAIVWNWLEGDSIALGIIPLIASDLPPVVYSAPGAQGSNTDLDSDGIRDLNGLEYAVSADELHIPRFIAGIGSSLILINLTGGPSFTAVANYLAYNDNEEVFSGQVSFDCWDRRHLSDISGIFTNDFLLSTNHNPNESYSGHETGWIRIWGSIAFSSAAQIARPAILVVRVDDAAFASLPYGIGENPRGDLVPHGPFGDLSP